MRDNNNPKLLMSKTEAAEKIQDRINIGKELLETQIYSEDELNNLEHKTEKWTDYNIGLFKKLFSESPLSPWIHGHKMVRSVYRENQVYNGTKEHKRYLAGWINDLESAYDQLELYEETTQVREKLRYAKENNGIQDPNDNQTPEHHQNQSRIASLNWKKILAAVVVIVPILDFLFGNSILIRPLRWVWNYLQMLL